MEPIQNVNNANLTSYNLQSTASNTTVDPASQLNYSYNNSPFPAFDPTVGFRATDLAPPSSDFRFTAPASLESSPVVTSKRLQSVPVKKDNPNHTGTIVAVGATALGTGLLIWKHKPVGKFFSELFGSAKKDIPPPSNVPSTVKSEAESTFEFVLDPLESSRKAKLTEAQQGLKNLMNDPLDLSFSEEGAKKVQSAMKAFDGSATGFENIKDKEIASEINKYFKTFYARHGDELLKDLNPQDQEALLMHRIRLNTKAPQDFPETSTITIGSRDSLLQIQKEVEEQDKLMQTLEDVYNKNSSTPFINKGGLEKIKNTQITNRTKIADQIKHVETLRRTAVRKMLRPALGDVRDISEDTLTKLLKYHDEGRHLVQNADGTKIPNHMTELYYNLDLNNSSLSSQDYSQQTRNFLVKALPDLRKDATGYYEKLHIKKLAELLSKKQALPPGFLEKFK